MADTSLFQPYKLGSITLTNRIVMAPLTRNRAGAGLVPSVHAAAYSAQRASAGLIITEATQVSEQAQGYQDTPGLYTPEQIAGWRKVNDALHAKGGRIFVQLWHVGRVITVSWPVIVKGIATFREPRIFMFFTSSANGSRAANAFVARLKERKNDRDKAVGFAPMLRQLKAIRALGRQPSQPLHMVRQPVLVVNGDHDIMVPSETSTDMAQRIPNARIVHYPDAGHDGIFQHHDAFLKESKTFLAN